MFFKAACLAVALTFTAVRVNAQEGLTPMEHAWIDAVNNVAEKNLKPDFTVKVAIYTEEADSSVSVIAASYKDSTCTMHLSARDNNQDTSVQAMASDPVIARLTVVAHEYGHCVHRLLQKQGASARKADQWPEAFADAYAIAWIGAYYPQYHSASIEFLLRLRSKDARGVYAMGVAVAKSAESFVLNTERPIMDKALAILHRARKE